MMLLFNSMKWLNRSLLYNKLNLLIEYIKDQCLNKEAIINIYLNFLELLELIDLNLIYLILKHFPL